MRYISPVALLAEGVDRNSPINSFQCSQSKVALLAEGVDRNNTGDLIPIYLDESPSSRRAWIEIKIAGVLSPAVSVALLAEGVDRNFCMSLERWWRWGRPPRGGRG